MNKHLPSILFVVIAFITWGIWTFGFSWVHIQAIQLFGININNPQYFWVSVIALSLVMGFLPSLLISLTANKITAFKAFTFMCLVAVITLAIGSLFGGLSSLNTLSLSYGFWSFSLGVLMGANVSRYVSKVTT